MKVFVSHDHEDTKRCAGLLRTLDAWGVSYYFDYAEDLFGQQLSNRVQAELAQSQVFVRVCTRATSRSYWMSIENGAFMGLIADEQRSGRSGRHIVSLILDAGYQREPFDVSTTVVDATDSAHPQWVNALRAALELPPLHDVADAARGIYTPPQAARLSRRAAIGLGAGVAALAVAGTGGLLLLNRAGSPTGGNNGGLTPPTQDPGLKWSFYAGNPKSLNGASIAATPILDNGTLYVGTEEGKLYALSADDSSVRWTYSPPQVDSSIATTPALANGVLYLVIDFVGLFAVSTAGQKVWELDEDKVFSVSQVVVANGLLYANAVGGYGAPWCVAVADLKGHQVATLTASTAMNGASPPLVANGRVYVGGDDGYVYAFDAHGSGPELWRAEAGAARAAQLKHDPFLITAQPTLSGSTLYVASQDSSIYALDAGSGQKIWSFPTNAKISLSSPVVAGGTVYVGSTDKNLYALDAHSGQLVWQYQAGDEINGTVSIANGVVYAGSYDKYVHAVDAKSGRLVHKYHIGGKVWARPIVANGVLYVATGNGWVLAFRLS